MASKRAPKVQPPAPPDTRSGRGLSPYRARAVGYSGYVCTYCGKPITWNQVRADDEIDARLAQEPSVPTGMRNYGRPLPARLSGPRLSDLIYGRVNYRMAHRWCRLKAILGPKRARHHRKGKKR